MDMTSSLMIFLDRNICILDDFFHFNHQKQNYMIIKEIGIYKAAN